jgi:hypothetical protein
LAGEAHRTVLGGLAGNPGAALIEAVTVAELAGKIADIETWQGGR